MHVDHGLSLELCATLEGRVVEREELFPALTLFLMAVILSRIELLITESTRFFLNQQKLLLQNLATNMRTSSLMRFQSSPMDIYLAVPAGQDARLRWAGSSGFAACAPGSRYWHGDRLFLHIRLAVHAGCVCRIILFCAARTFQQFRLPIFLLLFPQRLIFFLSLRLRYQNFLTVGTNLDQHLQLKLAGMTSKSSIATANPFYFHLIGSGFEGCAHLAGGYCRVVFECAGWALPGLFAVGRFFLEAFAHFVFGFLLFVIFWYSLIKWRIIYGNHSVKISLKIAIIISNNSQIKNEPENPLLQTPKRLHPRHAPPSPKTDKVRPDHQLNFTAVEILEIAD